MSVHPLVTQLRFTRSEFIRCLKDVSSEDGVRRIMPMNCISWIIGHLANQEQAYWVLLAQERMVVPGLNDLVGSGKPASTPPLNEMWAAWSNITLAVDPYLDTLTTTTLQTYHYWYHTGEAHAIRDMLGQRELPQFVGDMSEALYRPET